MTINHKILLTALVCINLQIASLFAQDNTMYMLHQLPQANILNPAVDFPCDFYIELPLLSSAKLAYNNSSFTYKDILRQGTGDQQDSLVLDFDNIYPHLRKNNYINLEVENVILGAGFHWKEYFISARIYHRLQSSVQYTKDLIGLKDGNWNPVTDSPINYQLAGNELNEISYWGISAAISRDFTSSLRLGARLSYLKGSSNFQTKNSELEISTTEQPVAVNIHTDYEVNASFPMEYQRDANGRIYSMQPVFDNFVKDFIFNSNRGVSIDFGAVYQYNDKIKLAVSVLNLGFIRWASNSVNLRTEGDINYIGVDLDQYALPNQNTDLIQILRDTISSSFHFYDSPTKYLTLLPARIFAGGTYQLSPITELALTGNISIINGATIPTITGSVNLKPNDFLNLSGSISYANRTIRNIGLAFILGNPSFNFYFVSDMLPINYVQETQSGLIFPYNSRSFNFRFGINLLFGCGNSKSGNSSRSGGKVCPAYR
ncbi:MAG: DUF5723 family protein [Bacteroidales bacterium]|nr:DUF5723 family protein [Bacteroidales bacterium]